MSLEFMMFEKNLQSANVLFKGGMGKKDEKTVPTSPPSAPNEGVWNEWDEWNEMMFVCWMPEWLNTIRLNN